MKRFKYLDAVRGWAILGVLAVHTMIYGNNAFPEKIKWLLGQGARGVQLFYIASALTIFMSYQNRSSHEINIERNFFIRRFFRIAPVFYLGILYFLLQNGFHTDFASGYDYPTNIIHVLTNATFIHGLSPYWIDSVIPGGWSITVEFTFYALVPFLFKRIKSLNQSIAFFLISIVLSFITIKGLKFIFPAPDQIWSDYFFLFFPSQLPVFALGIMLFFIMKEYESKGSVNIPVNIYLILILVLMVTVRELPIHYWAGFGFVLFVFVLSVREFKFFVNKLTCYIGKISYSLYISHLGVLYWMNKLDLIDFLPPTGLKELLINYLIRFVILLILASAVSSVLYKLVEVPMQKVGSQLINRLQSRKKITLANERAAV